MSLHPFFALATAGVALVVVPAATWHASLAGWTTLAVTAGTWFAYHRHGRRSPRG